MAKNIWALDFGDWSLKIVRGRYDSKAQCLVVDLYDEVIYGELPCGYEASSLDKHREGIIAFRSKYDIPARDDLCVAVPGNEVFSRFINLPPVPESLDRIIRYEAGQQIPFPLDSVVWDFQPVKEESLREVGEEIEVGLFAVKKERVQELMDLLSPWRRSLRIVQDAPLALYNLLAYEGLTEQALVVIDVGAATTDVLVLNPPRYWTRTLLVAGDDLTNALAEQFGVSVSEAEAIKRRAAKSAHREQILRILQPVFEDLINEIQRSLGYYKSLVRDVRFSRVLVLGNAMKMTGLDQMLSRSLQYEVQQLTGLKRIRLGDGVDKEKFQNALPGACPALGLLVQGAGLGRIRINMVPEEVVLAAAVQKKKPWAVAAAAGLAAVCGVLLMAERLYAQDLEKFEGRVPWDIVNQVANLEKQYSDEMAKVAQLKSKLEQLAQPGIDPALHLKLMSVLSTTLPQDVFLTSLKFQWVEPGREGEGLTLTVRPTGAVPTVVSPTPTVGAPGPTAPATGYFPGGGPPPGVVPAEEEIPEWARAYMAGGGEAEGPPPDALPPGMAPGTGMGMPLAGIGLGTPGAVGGAGVGPVRPAKSSSSVLRMEFAAESRVIKGGRDYIQKNVFEALEKALLPDRNEKAFSKVQMVSDVRDVYRRQSDGSLVTQLTPGATDVERFVAFSGYAIVNMGAGGPKQQ